MAKIRARALIAASRLQPKEARKPFAAAFRKYYDVRELSRAEYISLANTAMKRLGKNNQVGWRVFPMYGLLETAAWKYPKAEQLKAYEAIMSAVKPASANMLAYFAMTY